MRASVIVFPGSNCDRDVAVTLEQVTGTAPNMMWHGDTSLPESDLIVLPGGFAYGDYLRCGAMAVHTTIMKDVMSKANKGVAVLGICNGFQILTEMGLLPGVMMRNANLKYICRDVLLKVERTDTLFTNAYDAGEIIRIPVAHHDGAYFADADTLNMLEDNNRVAFRYCGPDGTVSMEHNPNGSQNNIAGVFDEKARILGLMPHPERLADPALGGTDGRALFESILSALETVE